MRAGGCPPPRSRSLTSQQQPPQPRTPGVQGKEEKFEHIYPNIPQNPKVKDQESRAARAKAWRKSRGKLGSRAIMDGQAPLCCLLHQVGPKPPQGPCSPQTTDEVREAQKLGLKPRLTQKGKKKLNLDLIKSVSCLNHQFS